MGLMYQLRKLLSNVFAECKYFRQKSSCSVGIDAKSAPSNVNTVELETVNFINLKIRHVSSILCPFYAKVIYFYQAQVIQL